MPMQTTAVQDAEAKKRKKKLERGGNQQIEQVGDTAPQRVYDTSGPQYQTYGAMDIPDDMQSAIDRRYALQMADIEKQTGKQYKLAGSGLQASAGQSGFGMGSGIANKAWKNLERETAGSILQQQGILSQQKMAEELGLMKAERGYQQELGKMGAEYGYKGAEAERGRDFQEWSQRFAADLTSKGWTHEEAMAEADRVWKSGESEAERGFKGEESALDRAQQENLLRLSQEFSGSIEEMKAQLARDLQTQGLDADAAQREADRQLTTWQTEEEMGWRREELGATIDQEQWMQDRVEALQREGWDVASAEAQAARDWQTGERTGTQTWQTGETAAGYEHEKAMLDLTDTYQRAMFDKQYQADLQKSIYTTALDIQMAYAQGLLNPDQMGKMQRYIDYLSGEAGEGFEGPSFWDPSGSTYQPPTTGPAPGITYPPGGGRI